jgi:hypothetical protein
MIPLNKVFGIQTDVPTYTYVDRANLDAKFGYLLNTDKHIVIHGASKQGKTSLRRKGLADSKVITIQCRSDTSMDDIYESILAKIGVATPKTSKQTRAAGIKVQGKATGGAGIPFFTEAKAEAGGEANGSLGTETASEYVGTDVSNLSWVAEKIKQSGKRLILEDSHYLPEEQKKKLAFDLKTLWDLQVFVIIVGVWAEQGFLTFYNGDLTGRATDIDLVWTETELTHVIAKGEEALNIRFSGSIKKQLINDAAQNVGLLQRLAEKVCFHSAILATQTIPREINDETILNNSRQEICNEERQRYRKLSDAIARGFKGYEESGLKVYERILRVCIEAPDDELKTGLSRDVLLKRVQKYEPGIRLSDLSAALNKIDKLQADRDISPLMLTYNSSNRRILLVDRELLFFRKYGNPNWPWSDEQDPEKSTGEPEVS